MAKRSLSSGPTTPRKRRAQVGENQSKLDNFFKPSYASPSKLKARPHRPPAETSPEPHILLTREEAASNLESLGQEAFGERLPVDSKTSRSTQPEVIDVDLLDDYEQPIAGPSTLATTHFEDDQQGLVLDGGSKVSGCSPTPVSPTRPTLGAITTDRIISYKPLAVVPSSFDIASREWPLNSPAPYSFLAHALSTLSGTRSRTAISNTLTNTLRVLSKYHPASLLPALYLLSNSLSPPHSPVELGLGPSIISKAIQHVSGLSSAALKRLYVKTGDAGDVAFEAKSNVRTLVPHSPLLITGVYNTLLKIAHAKGQGASKQKQALVEKLLVAAKGEETRFLVRTLSQNLRVGAVRTSILTALARAMVMTPANTSSDSPALQSRLSTDLISVAESEPVGTRKKTVDSALEVMSTQFIEAEALIKKVYAQHPNYDHIVQELLVGGLDGLLDRLPLTVGVPLLPTLGSPTRSLDEIYDRLGTLPFVAEFKYDGQRAQIHARRDNGPHPYVKIFSRHLEDMTDKYPDVISLVENIFAQSPETDSFIVDTEIVAIDPSDGSLKSFQELSNRARRDVRIDDVKISVCVFAFDIMYLDRTILIERPFRERRNLLRTRFPPFVPQQVTAARFDHVESCESTDGRDVVEEFWHAAVESRCEGLMIKLLDNGEASVDLGAQKDKSRRKPLPSTYEPDKRTSAWLKLKKDYVNGLGDSLDLVPIGAWHGNGRKASWWSPILLALWDPDAGRLVAVCKCMSGFSDTFYKVNFTRQTTDEMVTKWTQALRERYPENSDTCSPLPLWHPHCDTGGLRPEVFFKPQEVWEIRGADVTISPVSVAALGLVSKSRGLSLRFPRFMRIREDKGIEDASNPEFLAKMWTDQQRKDNDQGGADDGELIDVVEETDVEDSEAELDGG